jgi:hypothetical protein
MTDIFLAFLFGVLMGYIARPKDKDIEEQQAIYTMMYKKYSEDVKYYKYLCHWHVQQKEKK